MNWEAIGAIGELIGAIAVVLTLVFLTFQVRYSTRTMEESNRLERAAAMDRHTDSIGRWRGRLAESEELARIWLLASKEGELSDVDTLRLDNLWVDLVNSQRSNFVRANVVGEDGLARQAVLAIAVEINQSSIFRQEWKTSRPWHELASRDFVMSVEEVLGNLDKDGTDIYHAGTRR